MDNPEENASKKLEFIHALGLISYKENRELEDLQRGRKSRTKTAQLAAKIRKVGHRRIRSTVKKKVGVLKMAKAENEKNMTPRKRAAPKKKKREEEKQEVVNDVAPTKKKRKMPEEANEAMTTVAHRTAMAVSQNVGQKPAKKPKNVNGKAVSNRNGRRRNLEKAQSAQQQIRKGSDAVEDKKVEKLPVSFAPVKASADSGQLAVAKVTSVMVENKCADVVGNILQGLDQLRPVRPKKPKGTIAERQTKALTIGHATAASDCNYIRLHPVVNRASKMQRFDFVNKPAFTHLQNLFDHSAVSPAASQFTARIPFSQTNGRDRAGAATAGADRLDLANYAKLPMPVIPFTDAAGVPWQKAVDVWAAAFGGVAPPMTPPDAYSMSPMTPASPTYSQLSTSEPTGDSEPAKPTASAPPVRNLLNVIEQDHSYNMPPAEQSDKAMRQREVEHVVSQFVKPYLKKGKIDRYQYKQIMKKCVPTIVKAGGKLNLMKIERFALKYTKKIRIESDKEAALS